MVYVAALLAALAAPAQESLDEQLQAALKQLSAFARDVDSEKRTLRSLLDGSNKPEGWILEFRSLVHERPKLNPAVLAYLKSKDEPLGARALAVMALAHPHKDSVAELLGSVYTDGLDPKLVITAAFCYHNLSGGGFDWMFPLQCLGVAEVSPAWQFPSDTVSRPIRFIIGPPGNVNLNPMLEGLLKRLETGESGKMEHRSLSLAWEFSRRRHATEEHRLKIRKYMEKACLAGGSAWHTALDYFTDRHRKVKEADLDIIGRSLDRLTPEKRAYAMEEVVSLSPEGLYRPPFAQFRDGMIAYLSKSEKEGGPPGNTLPGILWAFVNEPGAEERAEFMLFKSPSITLRRRACGAVAGRCSYAKKAVGWDRWSPQVKRMLLDSDFEIGFVAAIAAAQELERRDSEFTRAERSLWWGRATDWVNFKTASALDPRESALLGEIRARLASRKP
jgi:hypothetical protein